MQRLPIGLLGALVVTACDGGGDPVQQALRETATANQSAAVSETPTPSVPLQSSDRAYIAGMIAQHRNAVAMAGTALKDSRDPEIRRMARVVVDNQTREIAEMQAWKPVPAN